MDLPQFTAANTMACIWTLFYACMVFAVAYCIRRIRPQGFHWAWRPVIVFSIYYPGILIQAFASLPYLSLPDLIGSAIPPVMISSLQMEFSYQLAGHGMNTDQAFIAAGPLAMKYGMCRFVLFLSFAFLWFRMRKAKNLPPPLPK